LLKYIGSKRRLVPALTAAARATGAVVAADLFTGTTRVARSWKAAGMAVTAADSASYSAVLAECFVAIDADGVDQREVADEIRRLDGLPGEPGYVTEVFCRRARFFQPHNGERIDAIRAAIEDYRGSVLYPIAMTALLLAADRVDSTTGVQMAYLKQWAKRSYLPLHLQPPDLLSGPGRFVGGDITDTVGRVGPVDLAYLDPPYNQHRYECNYHIWETLVRGDEPPHYGRACKRTDLRDKNGRSPFNSRSTFAGGLRQVIAGLDCETLMLSYNDESWVAAAEVCEWLADAGHAAVSAVGFDSARYVGAHIGIHNPAGEKVGSVGRTRNVEWLFIAGPAPRVRAAVAAATAHGAHPLIHA
jgi:adenine-specific DNA-methyltransferase